MNIELLYLALNPLEKDELYRMLVEEKTPKDCKTATTIKDFIQTHRAVMSVLLRRRLEEYGVENFVEVIDTNNMLKWRNVGKKIMAEFITLRGF